MDHCDLPFVLLVISYQKNLESIILKIRILIINLVILKRQL